MPATPDKNFKSYENLSGQSVTVGLLNPKKEGWEEWADTMKTYRCNDCDFMDGFLKGGDEDCLDVGTACNANKFECFSCASEGGKSIITLKSNSNFNVFEDFHLFDHGSMCDIRQGEWSDSDNSSNEGNVYIGWTTNDNSPVTYAYRLFSGSTPEFIDMNAKHLWWLSIGMTIAFWAKWLRIKLFGD